MVWFWHMEQTQTKSRLQMPSLFLLGKAIIFAFNQWRRERSFVYEERACADGKGRIAKTKQDIRRILE